MYKILALAFIIFCGRVQSQVYTPVNPTAYGNNVLRSKPILVQHVPRRDSLWLNTNDTTPQIFVYNDMLLYYHGGSYDVLSNKATTVDTIYQRGDSMFYKVNTTETFGGKWITSLDLNNYLSKALNDTATGGKTFQGYFNVQTDNDININSGSSHAVNISGLTINFSAANAINFINPAYFYLGAVFLAGSRYTVVQAQSSGISNSLYLPVVNSTDTLATKSQIRGAVGTSNLQQIANNGNYTTTSMIAKGGNFAGDSTNLKTATFEGSSLTVQVFEGYIVSPTQTWPQLISNQYGWVCTNEGVGGRTLQQITVGDNSLFSNILLIPYNTTVFIEGMVNDVKGDTTKLNTSLYGPQLTAYIDTCIARNDVVVFFNPSYYNPATPGTNQGNIPYRQYIYDTTASGICSRMGVKYYNAYSNFYNLYTANNNLLYGDSIHMTIQGAIAAQGLLSAQLISWGFTATPTNIATVIQAYANISSLGNINAGDSVTAQVVNANDFASNGKTRVQGQFVLGSNSLAFGVTPNFAKFGSISAYTYSDSLNQPALWQPFSYYSNNSTTNNIAIGTLFTPSLQNPGKAGTNIIYGLSIDGTQANAKQVEQYYGSGRKQQGTTSNYTDNHFSSYYIQTHFNYTTGATPSAIYLNPRDSIRADNMTVAALVGNYQPVQSGVISGTIVQGSGYATGTYNGVALTGGSGTGATANITVNGTGNVSVVVPAVSGNDYVVGNVLSAAASFDGVGAGSGFTYTITALGKLGEIIADLKTVNYPLQLSSIASTTPISASAGMVGYSGGHFYGNAGGTLYQLDRPTVLGTISTSPYTTAGIIHNTVTTGAFTSSLISTADINLNAVNYARMQSMTANKLLGSGASGTAVAEMTLGTGLSFTTSTLNVTGVQFTTVAAAAGTTGTVSQPMGSNSAITVVPTGSITFNATGGTSGQKCTFIITTSGTTSDTITFGTNFKSQGTLASGVLSGKVFTVEFVYDGTNWDEIARVSTGM